MRKYYLISTFFLIFNLLIAGSYLSADKVYAQEPAYTNSTAPGKKFYGFELKNVNLSQEQIEKMAPIESDFRSEMKSINTELKTKHSEKTTLLKTYPLDAEKIIAKQGEINDLNSQLQNNLTIYQIKMLQVLTEEQFTEFNLVTKKHDKKRPRK